MCACERIPCSKLKRSYSITLIYQTIGPFQTNVACESVRKGIAVSRSVYYTINSANVRLLHTQKNLNQAEGNISTKFLLQKLVFKGKFDKPRIFSPRKF